MITRLLKHIPLFLLLLPLYYLIHLLFDYYGLFSFTDLFSFQTLIYLGLPAAFLVLCIKNDSLRYAALPLFVSELFFFFFSIVQDIVKNTFPLFGRYIILLPGLFLLVLATAIFVLRKRKTYTSVYLYLNLLFIIIIGVDLIRIAAKNVYGEHIFSRNSQQSEIEKKITPCKQCEKPDIYFLIFDGYTSTSVIKNQFSYDNSSLDSFLVNRGFYVAEKSTSNYNSTAYSIASILQMNYHDQPLAKQIETIDFYQAEQLINKNPLCSILEKEGYKIINYSIFRLLQKKSPVEPFKIADPEKILQSQTFWYAFKNDIAWNFNFIPTQNNYEKDIILKKEQTRKNIARIQQTVDGIKSVSSQNFNQPVFVYGHILLPHSPYIYDSLGNISSPEKLMSGAALQEKYLQQLIYTRKLIEELVVELQKNPTKPRIIILQGDHGYQFYRDYGKESNFNKYSFSNLNAIYFPGQNYSMLYDSISSVNTFRVILKRYLKADMPLLKDTSFFSTTK